MSTRTVSAEEARLRAEERFKKTALREREAAEARRFQQEKDKAETAKVDRLRALRLARDAQQAEAAAQKLADQQNSGVAPAEKRKRRSKADAAADTAEATAGAES
ncbi:hypothetical protein [Ferrovibrio sp.]|uniref:hypothetical protein n=1 Tax=Ferrovibrio sp. TaxID=1917215 RepID=UPI0026312F57|nr:hypothetical protein [Ferrovibrio sp.]